MNQAAYELYRQSSVGTTLIDSLDELVQLGRIEPQLANKILQNFDKTVTEVLAERVKARLTFKGHLDTYRFCDEVWTFLIKDVNFKLDNQNPIQADKIKISFFLLNLAFNALMWALFTSALTRASSTTRVSIINTSSNFLITALLGLIIFSEKLPPLWWVGAAGLVVGNVVIGRREEGEFDKPPGVKGLQSEGEGAVGEGYRDEVGNDEVNDDVLELDADLVNEAKAVKKGDGVDEGR
ncbi:MAG: hypothetical protein Q9166_002716 [cf. Caloplaca sp. 2 TL-2023]